MPQVRISSFHFLPRILILMGCFFFKEKKKGWGVKNSAAIFLRLTLAHLLTSVTHSFWGKEGYACALWDCLPLWCCLFASAAWERGLQSCPPWCKVWFFNYMVEIVVLSPSSRFGSSEVTGALQDICVVWCGTALRDGAMLFLTSLHMVLPKMLLLVLQMVFLSARGLFSVFDLNI